MATRDFVPRANEEGNLGTNLKRWLKGWFKDIFVGNTITDGTDSATVANIKDSVDKKHTQNTDTHTTSDSFKVGDDTNTTKHIYARNGDGNEPDIKYNHTDNVWEYANDGLTFKYLGGLQESVLSKTVNPTNLLLNGNFEHWYAGTTSAPDGWEVVTPANGSTARDAGTVKFGTYSTKLTYSTGPYAIREVGIQAEKGIEYWKGRKITLSCWVWCDTANRAAIQVFDGVTATQVYHSGGGGWELLTVVHTVQSTATVIEAHIQVRNGVADGYFDGAMLVEGSIPFAYIPNVEDNLYEQSIITVGPTSVLQNDANVNYNGERTEAGGYAYSGVLNQYMEFIIPMPIQDRSYDVVIDSMVVYYNTQDNPSYIDSIVVSQNDLDGTKTVLINHTDDLGNGSNGNANHDIVDSSITITATGDLWFYLKMLGCTASTDARFFGAVIKYHVKVHS